MLPHIHTHTCRENDEKNSFNAPPPIPQEYVAANIRATKNHLSQIRFNVCLFLLFLVHHMMTFFLVFEFAFCCVSSILYDYFSFVCVRICC